MSRNEHRVAGVARATPDNGPGGRPVTWRAQRGLKPMDAIAAAHKRHRSDASLSISTPGLGSRFQSPPRRRGPTLRRSRTMRTTSAVYIPIPLAMYGASTPVTNMLCLGRNSPSIASSIPEQRQRTCACAAVPTADGPTICSGTTCIAMCVHLAQENKAAAHGPSCSTARNTSPMAPRLPQRRPALRTATCAGRPAVDDHEPSAKLAADSKSTAW